MNAERVALIYTNRLLPYSETFIRDHGRTLERYRPCYVGCRRVDGIDLAPAPSMVLNEGGLAGSLRELRFKVRGTGPALVRRLRTLQPSLLHAHFGGCAAVALPLVEALNLPFIVTFHGLDATVTDRNRLRQLSLTPQLYLRRRDRLMQRADLFLTVTHDMRRVLVAQGFPADKVRVHNLGIDTSFFAPERDAVREPVVLFVGRLVEKKGCAFLIEAMASVQQHRPDAELVVIGDGPLRASLEQQAARSLQRYRFLGQQPPADVRRWMSRARVFSMPSIVASTGDREGFGIVFLEAQAMGTPVVSFASGGIPEAVAHGETGFLAPERDVAALADGLLRLFRDDALWTTFSRSGIERVRTRFDGRNQGRRLEQLYDEVVERYHAGPDHRPVEIPSMQVTL